MLEERKVFTKKNIAVIVLSLMTIILFATSQWTEEAFGDIAIISLSFVAVMFSTGILTEVNEGVAPFLLASFDSISIIS